MVTADPWPLQSSLELGALPTAVPCARLHARQMLWEWGLNGLAEAAELLVSELVTNAVQAAAGRDRLLPIRLHLSSDKERLLIEVWDADPRPPVLAGLGEDGIPALGDEGGRGLFLVATLSQRWSWYASRKWGGKVVWSELQLGVGHEGHEHVPDHLREGAPSAMSSPASRSSTMYPPEAFRAPAPAPVSAPGTTLPLRPQAARAGTRRWVPGRP